MPTTLETSQDAITEDDINGTIGHSMSQNNKRNAFTDLMAPKPKKKTAAESSIVQSGRHFADGLGVYINDPTGFPLSRVIYHNDNFVAINDLYPKSSVHTLLLPRSANINKLHPFDAFENPIFLAEVQKETEILKALVAKELQRRYGKYSIQEQDRERALNGEVEVPEGQELPEGRDWEKDVMTGIHAHPSMSHLHVHVMSVDRFSEWLRHKKHYNSFTTPFFISIDDFPLDKDDVRRHPGREGYLKADYKCWRCGKNFGNAFTKLKTHLAEEFEAWKQQ